MDEGRLNPKSAESVQNVESISIAEFLESIPPSQSRPVLAPIQFRRKQPDEGPSIFSVTFPEIQLHCSNDSCNGPRFFRADRPEAMASNKHWSHEFLTYRCGNCQKQIKVFALAIIIQTTPDRPMQAEHLHCLKFGEYPVYGPPTPPRLISLIGPDRELFLKGRRCENQGLGIGAFGYYRRVVEDQKNRIIDEIIKVARVVGTPPESIASLEDAKKEHQFSASIESLKSVMPQRLLIAGQNPLTLLHSALSKGLHNDSDEKCLELAQDIRLVLAELSDLLGQALKDERELKEAVSRLIR